MNKYVYLNKNSLSKEFCLDIIDLFENEDTGKYPGVTRGGLQKNIKDTTDFIIDSTNDKWCKYHKFLRDELNRNIKKYLKTIRDEFKKKSEFIWNYFDDEVISYNVFLMQKYIKKTGKYVFHDDFSIDYQEKKYRAFTFLWYLNDIEVGGETEFEEFKIKPQAGSLLLFPATWCFPHSGKMPISDDKYIITGWVYVNF